MSISVDIHMYVPYAFTRLEAEYYYTYITVVLNIVVHGLSIVTCEGCTDMYTGTTKHLWSKLSIYTSTNIYTLICITVWSELVVVNYLEVHDL